jgi:LmbE family N-acetylglucosaminyl deacetylase
MIMNIVVVGAHQDDMEVNCSGTLLKYRQKGDVNITIVVISNGDKGFQHKPSVPYEEATRIRNAEATRVAEALGGRYICLGQSDEYMADTPEARNQVVDILREAKADVVFTLPPQDYNADHMVASQITFQAVMLAPVTTIFTDHEPLRMTPVMYYMDSAVATGFEPSHYVDITDVWEQKCELLRMHVSQMDNAKFFGDFDLVELSQIVGAYRGMQSRVKYAECFRPAPWPRARAGNVLP